MHYHRGKSSKVTILGLFVYTIVGEVRQMVSGTQVVKNRARSTGAVTSLAAYVRPPIARYKELW